MLNLMAERPVGLEAASWPSPSGRDKVQGRRGGVGGQEDGQEDGQEGGRMDGGEDVGCSMTVGPAQDGSYATRK